MLGRQRNSDLRRPHNNFPSRHTFDVPFLVGGEETYYFPSEINFISVLNNGLNSYSGEYTVLESRLSNVYARRVYIYIPIKYVIKRISARDEFDR